VNERARHGFERRPAFGEPQTPTRLVVKACWRARAKWAMFEAGAGKGQESGGNHFDTHFMSNSLLSVWTCSNNSAARSRSPGCPRDTTIQA
jgi:hypothetical protein